jgi:1-phosphofructokinase
MNRVPLMLTLTGNLLAERTLEFAAWSPGRTQRARAESFQVGGKGINVAKMLRRLGSPHLALGFTGGASGAECEAWLRARDFSFHAFPTPSATRTGTVVRSPDQPETTFLGVDVAPDAAAIRAAVDFLTAQPAGSILALCGSFPGWDTPAFDPLRSLLERWPVHGPLVVDTYGPPLAWLAGRPAALVKVNRSEFSALFSPAEQCLPPRDQLCLARERYAARRWVVTDGAEPIWVYDDQGDPGSLIAPRVREVSATGSGDVMLACILHAHFHRGLHWRDAVAWSLPYGAANAAHGGVAEFPDPPV